MIQEKDFFDNITDKDIRDLVTLAQGSMRIPFSKAVYHVAMLTGKHPDAVYDIASIDLVTEALIEEANRVPLFIASKKDENGQLIIF